MLPEEEHQENEKIPLAVGKPGGPLQTQHHEEPEHPCSYYYTTDHLEKIHHFRFFFSHSSACFSASHQS